ncbi:MAG: hypothetical protein FIB06_01440 [Betaproteobacteria bacterium]|nr:hypothetical protein [Betaproteobacteria bacterium]
MTPGIAQRLLLLAACIGGGLGAGLAGYLLTGEQAWFLALPAAMAAGWMVVGDPTRCTPDATHKVRR